MKDSEKIISMNNEIRIISRYRALIISRYYMAVCLVISFFVLSYTNYTVSPLYILSLLYILPPILSFAFRDYAKRYNTRILKYIMDKTSFTLSTLKKKYHYTRVNSISHETAFYLALILLGLWQYNYSHLSSRTILSYPYLPITILGSSIFARYTAVVFYLLKLPYDLRNNRV